MMNEKLAVPPHVVEAAVDHISGLVQGTAWHLAFQSTVPAKRRMAVYDPATISKAEDVDGPRSRL